ncbi:sodium:calcium antiporter [Pontibacillus salicampi]|uniref:Sodium:calcium antiporter n=1 Tax=Pontibacillus salicampi TaxID=1449801 RepID=A0ABV6LQ13_9BACI
MVYGIFIAAAFVVIMGAIYLNRFGDVISRKSALSGAAVGTFLIAGATSLPELTTSFTAVYIDNTDIAVGNMLGSNVFNLLIIASMDVVYRRKKLFQHASARDNVPTALIGLLFTLIIIIALINPGSIELFNVGVEMVLIFVMYAVYIKLSNSSEEEKEEEQVDKDYNLKTAIYGFIGASVVVFVAGSALSISGDRLATITGMNSSFVGSFLIAAATSLPEFVAVLAAIKMANYNMAIGSILGSNLFNLQILFLTDVMYQDSAILKAVHTSNMYIAILCVFMIVVVMFNLLRTKGTGNTWMYAAPSLLVTLVYFVVSYTIF